jgi:hypothetical protein
LLQKSNLSILAIDNSCFFSSTKLGNIFQKQIFLEGRTIQGHKCKTKHFPQTTKVSDFSQSKYQGLVNIIFATYHPF